MAFLGLIPWSLFVDACRLLSVLAFILCSLTFSWYSFFSLISVIVSLYVMDRNAYSYQSTTTSFPGKNPYRRKKRVKDEDKIPENIKQKYAEKILDLVLYDVENCQAVRNFEPIQVNTHCTFAKKSILWGAVDYDRSLSVEQNVTRSLPALVKFFSVGPSLHLDGFVFELPGDEFGQDVHQFGGGVRRVLKCISNNDPAGFHCMNKSYISKVGWSFEFDSVPIFVTTFAPCYPENHSRYAFGAENSFILLQPMYSFVIHDIGEDTPKTNWKCPVTVRDKIRVAYKDNNRGYYIRDTIIYPAAHDVVKPLNEGVGDLVEWWVDPEHPDDVGTGEGDSEEGKEESDVSGEDDLTLSEGELNTDEESGGDGEPETTEKKTQ